MINIKGLKLTAVLCTAVLSAAMIASCSTQTGDTDSAQKTQESFKVYCTENRFERNGEEHTLNGEIFSRNGEIYIPADDILPACGYTMGYDAEKQAIIVSKDGNNTLIYKNRSIIVTGGAQKEFDMSSVSYNDILYIPMKMFSAISDETIEFEGDMAQRNTGWRDLMDDTQITDQFRKTRLERCGNVFIADGHAVMEQLAFAPENGVNYARVVNAIAAALPEVQVYDLLIPSVTEFYGPKEIYTNQIDGIREIYHMLDECIIPINALKEMWAHADEKLYFDTDHHWTQRGAYYAYKAFMDNKGEEVPSLDKFEKADDPDFIGSFPGVIKDAAVAQRLRSQPELMERFMPIVGYTGGNYSDMYMQNKLSDAMVVNPVDKTYVSFILGDQPITHFVTTVKNGRKLVILKESYGDAFATWAVNNYEEVFIIDPRKWNGMGSRNEKFNLVEFYNNVSKFDDLIIVSYPGSTASGIRQGLLHLVEN